jgi:hypothetical protein
MAQLVWTRETLIPTESFAVLLFEASPAISCVVSGPLPSAIGPVVQAGHQLLGIKVRLIPRKLPGWVFTLPGV